MSFFKSTKRAVLILGIAVELFLFGCVDVGNNGIGSPPVEGDDITKVVEPCDYVWGEAPWNYYNPNDDYANMICPDLCDWFIIYNRDTTASFGAPVKSPGIKEGDKVEIEVPPIMAFSFGDKDKITVEVPSKCKPFTTAEEGYNL